MALDGKVILSYSSERFYVWNKGHLFYVSNL